MKYGRNPIVYFNDKYNLCLRIKKSLYSIANDNGYTVFSIRVGMKKKRKEYLDYFYIASKEEYIKVSSKEGIGLWQLRIMLNRDLDDIFTFHEIETVFSLDDFETDPRLYENMLKNSGFYRKMHWKLFRFFGLIDFVKFLLYVYR